MQALTARQQQMLDFIRERIDSDAVRLSRAGIAELFGFADPGSAQHIVAALVGKNNNREEQQPGPTTGTTNSRDNHDLAFFLQFDASISP